MSGITISPDASRGLSAVKRAALAAWALAAIRIFGAIGVVVAYAAFRGSTPPSGIAVDLIAGGSAGVLLAITAAGIRQEKKGWGIAAVAIALLLLLARFLVTAFGAGASGWIVPVAILAIIVEVILTGVLLQGVISLVPGWSRLDAKWHCGIVIAILIVTGIGFSVYSGPKQQMLPLRKPLSEFPREFMGHTWQSDRLRADIEKEVGADEYLNLTYGKTVYDKKGEAYLEPRATVYATYNGSGAGRIPHVPWVCMTGGGYKLTNAKEIEVEIPDLAGQAVPASALKDRPWMCLVSVGPTLFISSPTKGIPVNLLKFEHPEDRKKQALMVQYFNVGGYYTPNRQVARFQAWWKGGYLAQAQISVWLTEAEALLSSQPEPLETGAESRAHKELMQLLMLVAPELEKHLPE